MHEFIDIKDLRLKTVPPAGTLRLINVGGMLYKQDPNGNRSILDLEPVPVGPAIIGTDFAGSDNVDDVSGGPNCSLYRVIDGNFESALTVVFSPLEVTSYTMGYDPAIYRASFDFSGIPNCTWLDLNSSTALITVTFRGMENITNFSWEECPLSTANLIGFTSLETVSFDYGAVTAVYFPSPCAITSITLPSGQSLTEAQNIQFISALHDSLPPPDGVANLYYDQPATAYKDIATGGGNLRYTLTAAGLASSLQYTVEHALLTSTDGPIGNVVQIVGTAIKVKYISVSATIGSTIIPFDSEAYFKRTISGPITFSVSGKSSGKSINLSLTMNGAYAITWPTGGDAINWGVGGIPTCANGTTTQVVLTVSGSTINGAWTIAGDPAPSTATGTQLLAVCQAHAALNAIATVSAQGTISGSMGVRSPVYLGFRKLYRLLQAGWTINNHS